MDDPVAYYVERIMHEEIRIDLSYMRRATVWSDLLVLIKTALAALKRIGGGR